MDVSPCWNPSFLIQPTKQLSFRLVGPASVKPLWGNLTSQDGIFTVNIGGHLWGNVGLNMFKYSIHGAGEPRVATSSFMEVDCRKICEETDPNYRVMPSDFGQANVRFVKFLKPLLIRQDEVSSSPFDPPQKPELIDVGVGVSNI